MDKQTGEALLDKDGNTVTAENVFTPEKPDGTAEVVFTFDGTGLAGKTVVAFEELSRNDRVYAVHADIEDEEQTVHIPEICTSAVDGTTESHTGLLGEKTQVIDTVSYMNLIPGKEYTVKGVLMDKSTGEEFLDAEGNTVTAEMTFTPEKADGSIDVVFEFTGAESATIVVMEELYYNDTLVAEHTDIEDESQTVAYLKPQTESPEQPKKPKTGDKSPIEALAVITAATGAALAVLLYVKKKDHEKLKKMKKER